MADKESQFDTLFEVVPGTRDASFTNDEGKTVPYFKQTAYWLKPGGRHGQEMSFQINPGQEIPAGVYRLNQSTAFIVKNGSFMTSRKGSDLFELPMVRPL